MAVWCMTRELPRIAWTAVLIGGAVAVVVTILLSLAGAGLGAVAAGVAAGATVSGRLAPAAGAYHGALVAVLWIAAEAFSEPFRPSAGDVVADLAATLLWDAARVATGLVFGWLGARLPR